MGTAPRRGRAHAPRRAMSRGPSRGHGRFAAKTRARRGRACENAGMDGRAIEDLRRLAAQDEQLAEREHGLRKLDSEVRRIRERAEGFEAFFAHFEDAGSRAE